MIKNFNYVMGESGCSLTVLDVVEALQAKYAFISGGKTTSGSPIVTFRDDHRLAPINDETYHDIVTYLASIPSLQEVDDGFVIIVDRRHDKWGSSARTLLLRISGYFPGLVQRVIVLRPNGFLQRTFTNMGYKLAKEDFKFKVVVCGSLDELHQLVDPSQLTEELGGSIVYDHSVWIQHRAAIEKFSASTTQTGETLQALCRRVTHTQFPNDVPATRALIAQTRVTESGVKADLSATIRHGEVLLTCFRTLTSDDLGEREELDSRLLSPSRQLHITAVERLLVQLEETSQNFSEFWSNHERKLQQCLQLRQFEEEFKQLQSRVAEHVAAVEAMLDVGDSLQRVQTLLSELEQMDACAKADVSSAEELDARGRHLMEDDHYAVDCIRPKCLELQRMVMQYRDMVRARNLLLQRSLQLQTDVDLAHHWCLRGTDLLANQHIEAGSQLTWAHDALVDIESFLSCADQLSLTHGRDVAQLLASDLGDDAKVSLSAVVRRLDEVRAMCERRRASLVKLFEKPVRPVHPVAPAVNAAAAATAIDRKRRYFSRRSGSEANLTDRSRLSVELTWPDQNVSFASNSDSAIHSDSEKTDSSEHDTTRAKRRHVMKELIETERLYVSELGSVLKGYADEMDNIDLLHLMPEKLRGNKHVLFGNMQQIYDFHNDVFLKELESCRDTPVLVGTCFVRRKDEFKMYSTYCQNKPLAERLRRDVGDNNPFFKECKQQLNHKLPLGSYLLKPVQRITKYQLLLREMLRHADNEAGCDQLAEAVTTMLTVLKYVNDIMHQVAITGYSIEASDVGRLLMQGPFSVWTGHKRLRELRFKPMQRHVFLYENRLLFCKKHDVPQNADKATYVFKNSLEVSRVRLTENLKGDTRKFELWLHARTEVYILQASSVQVKEMWITEIKKLLTPMSIDFVRKAPSLNNLSHELSLAPERRNNNVSLPRPPRRMSSRSHDADVTYDDAGWSSEESEDFDAMPSAAFIADFTTEFHGLETQQYVSLADYSPGDSGEIMLHEGDVVDVLKVGSEGWWLVRCAATGDEGWAPSTYLESSKRSSTYSTVSTASTESSGKDPVEIKH